MSSIKEIRKLTGLSQAKMASWLGISKSLLQFAENQKRSLPTKVILKLGAITLLLGQMKAADKTSASKEITYSDPAKLAARHKKKMDFHQRSAAGLKIQLQKFKTLHPQLNTRLALLEAMKHVETQTYTTTEQDKYWIGLIEFFTNERTKTLNLDELDLMQDKIELHQAYAELHRQRWQKFLSMQS